MRDKEHRSTSATIYSSKFNLIDQSILYRELEYRYVSPTRGNSLNWDIFSIHVALTSVACRDVWKKHGTLYTRGIWNIFCGTKLCQRRHVENDDWIVSSSRYRRCQFGLVGILFSSFSSWMRSGLTNSGWEGMQMKKLRVKKKKHARLKSLVHKSSMQMTSEAK